MDAVMTFEVPATGIRFDARFQIEPDELEWMKKALKLVIVPPTAILNIQCPAPKEKK